MASATTTFFSGSPANSTSTVAKECLDKFNSLLHGATQGVKDSRGPLETRAADFRLWVDSVDACGKPGFSLDSRLRDRPDDLSMVNGILRMLSSFLDEYTKLGDDIYQLVNSQGHAVDSQAHAKAALDNIDSVISNLAVIGVAIHRSGRASRSRRVDASFRSEDYPELRQHLECIVLLRPTCDALPGRETIRSSALSNIQERLINANLRRRHRFIVGQKRSQIRARQQQQNAPHSLPVISTTTNREANTAVTAKASAVAPEADQGQQARDRHKAYSPSIISGFSKASTAEGPLLSKPQDRGPGDTLTQISAIARDADFPQPPATPMGLTARCPCCCQLVSVADTMQRDKAWKRHIVEDVCPYTCIADNCPSPHLLFTSRGEWEAHIEKDHPSSWLCPFCEPEDVIFEVIPAFKEHISSSHTDEAGGIAVDDLISWSTVHRLGIAECPLCPSTGPTDSPELVDHVLAHAYEFALRSLPWSHQKPNNTEPNGYFAFPQDQEKAKDMQEWLDKADLRVNLDPSLYSLIDRRPQVPDQSDSTEGDYFLENDYFHDKVAGQASSQADLGSVSQRSRLSSVIEERDPARPLPKAAYTTALIFAEDFELTAFLYMLDEDHGQFPSPEGASITYFLGRVGDQNVVLAHWRGVATRDSVAAFVHLPETFPSIQWRILVGIGGGFPSKLHDIRLGDVVVSMPQQHHGGIVEHDLGQQTDEMFPAISLSHRPPNDLHTVVGQLASTGIDQDSIRTHVLKLLDHSVSLKQLYSQPSRLYDVLFPDNVPHKSDTLSCNHCDASLAISREARESGDWPEIHFGLIASGDTVVKGSDIPKEISGMMRDDTLCFETEAAGLVRETGLLMIRGIADYVGPHKTSVWQYYAAAAAAACAKELLLAMPPTSQPMTEEARSGLGMRSSNSRSETGESRGSRVDMETMDKDMGPDTTNLEPTTRRSTLIDRLRFPEMGSRESSVPEPHTGTCDWFLETDEFKDWVAKTPESWQNHLLWIKGNPGAGKSVLMKYAVNHARRTSNTDLVLSHFFNRCGTALEKSAEGMCRTLLVGCLAKLPQDAEIELLRKIKTNAPLSTVELWRLLRLAMSYFTESRITIYIDGLDEIVPEELLRVLRSFQESVRHDWENGNRTQVCFASRRYPIVTFPYATYMDIHQEPGHHRAIKSYIESNLHFEDTNSYQGIKQALSDKAQGMFLWATGMVNLLNADWERGRPYEPEWLERYPHELELGYYEALLRDSGSQHERRLCFWWLVFTESSSASLSTLWWAVQLGLGRSDEEIQQKYHERDESSMGKYIVRISSGLVEIVKPYHEVKFVHWSLRMVLADGEPPNVSRVHNGDESKADIHEQLRDWCTAELAARQRQVAGAVEATRLRGAKSLYEEMVARGWFTMSSSVEVPLPFAWRAAVQIWRQTEAAQQHGRDQTLFLEGLPALIGPAYLASDGMGEVQAYSSVISSLLVHNCPELIRQTQLQAAQRARRAGQAFGLASDGTWQSALYFALCHGYSSVEALVEIYLDLEPRHPSLQQLLHRFTGEVNTRPPSYSPSARGSLLDVAVITPSVATFFLLALVPSGALEPHLNALESMVHNQSRSDGHFSQVLGYLIQEGLSSDAVDYEDDEIRSWLLDMREEAGGNE